MILPQWLRQLAQRWSPRANTYSRRVRPTLEVLEDRTVPTSITYHGGPTIPHVQVNNIVMGPQSLDAGALVRALVQDYLPLMGPYYGIGAGTLRSSINVAPLPGNPTDGQIQSFLLQEIRSGAVPPPGPNQLYMVFLAPGQAVPDVGFLSYHGYFFTPGIGAIYYAVVYGAPGQTSISASHELAESVTDPDGFSGYIDLSLDGGANGEVADIYQSVNATFPLNGYPVAVLSGPQGQPIGIAPPATLQNLITLAIQEAEALAFQYFASIAPQLAPYAQNATLVVESNLLYDTPQGQMAVLLGELMYSNLLSQQNGG